MKRIVLICISGLLSLLLWQCTTHEPDDNYRQVVLPVTAVDLPAKCRVDSVSIFTVHYKKPSTCHMFNGFYYDKSGMTRIVAVTMVQAMNASCITDGTVVSADLKFKPATAGDYTFKFWLGTDNSGNDTFIEQPITVLP